MARIIGLVFCWLVLAIMPAAAQERILSFDSDVTVQADGSFLVVETIQVRAEGNQIRRGIFRDIPTVFENEDGRELNVTFDLVGVTRDGAPDNVSVERSGRFVRVRIGNADVFLSSGNYTYQITYVTDRQLRRFESHDEVFWNVTGNAWAFQIDQATATVRLPDGATIEDTIFFTGRSGSTGQDARAGVLGSGNVARFQATRVLAPYEGLTVGVKFPKGIIPPPTQEQELQWWLDDYRNAIISVLGVLAVFVFYLFAWLWVGRDPEKGTIIPRWDLPKGISPALAHYIYNRGMKKQGFTAISAAALSLAVKGIVELQSEEDSLRITKLKSSFGHDLPIGEASLIKAVDGAGGVLNINKANGKRVQSMASKFRHDMEGEHRNKFFISNAGFAAFGVLLSIAAGIAIVWTANFSNDVISVLVPFGFGGIWLTGFAMAFAKGSSTGLGGKIRLAFILFVVVAIATNGAASAMFFLREMAGFYLPIGALITIALLNVLFFFLLGAPTPLGQERTAEIEGMRHYLSVAEEDRMNMLGSPEMSPQHYETLLPYAVALGVEKPWSRAFQGWLAAAAAAGAAAAVAYRNAGPSWYSGSRFNPDRMADTFGDIGNDMASTMTASMPAPKSSSSGFSGGGSSGGGGGGGGGGGW